MLYSPRRRPSPRPNRTMPPHHERANRKVTDMHKRQSAHTTRMVLLPPLHSNILQHPLIHPLIHPLTKPTRGDVSTPDKHAYIAAVKCLLTRPSQLDPTHYPGARTRFDDFVVVHMRNAPHIHFTGSFLHAHRLFTAAFEHALQTECGYTGTQPYWNWGRWASSVETSPLFDGSDTSIGGQGEYMPHESNIWRPAGKGGGCIASGPFVGMQVNLGYVFSLFLSLPPFSVYGILSQLGSPKPKPSPEGNEN